MKSNNVFRTVWATDDDAKVRFEIRLSSFRKIGGPFMASWTRMGTGFLTMYFYVYGAVAANFAS